MHKTIIPALILALGHAVTATAGTLRISVETNSAAGDIRAAVYSGPQAFERGDCITGVAGPAKPGVTELEIKGLKPGTYGVALFRDLNGNKKLDRNLLGAPSEPFGFSNNPVIGFSAPEFEDFKFEFDGKSREIHIRLNGG